MADRLWFQEELFSAPVLEAPAVSAKAQATADRRRAACRLLLAAAVVRQRLAVADHLWFREESFSAPVLEAPAVSAKATADRRGPPCRLLAAAVVRQRLAVADHLWFREESFSAPVLEAPAGWARAQSTAGRR